MGPPTRSSQTSLRLCKEDRTEGSVTATGQDLILNRANQNDDRPQVAAPTDKNKKKLQFVPLVQDDEQPKIYTFHCKTVYVSHNDV